MKSLFLFMVRNGGMAFRRKVGNKVIVEICFAKVDYRCAIAGVELDDLIGSHYLIAAFKHRGTASDEIFIPNAEHPDYPSPDNSLVKLIGAMRPMFEKLNIDIDEVFPAFDQGGGNKQ